MQTIERVTAALVINASDDKTRAFGHPVLPGGGPGCTGEDAYLVCGRLCFGAATHLDPRSDISAPLQRAEEDICLLQSIDSNSGRPASGSLLGSAGIELVSKNTSAELIRICYHKRARFAGVDVKILQGGVGRALEEQNDPVVRPGPIQSRGRLRRTVADQFHVATRRNAEAMIDLVIAHRQVNHRPPASQGSTLIDDVLNLCAIRPGLDFENFCLARGWG